MVIVVVDTVAIVVVVNNIVLVKLLRIQIESEIGTHSPTDQPTAPKRTTYAP